MTLFFFKNFPSSSELCFPSHTSCLVIPPILARGEMPNSTNQFLCILCCVKVREGGEEGERGKEGGGEGGR